MQWIFQFYIVETYIKNRMRVRTLSRRSRAFSLGNLNEIRLRHICFRYFGGGINILVCFLLRKAYMRRQTPSVNDGLWAYTRVQNLQMQVERWCARRNCAMVLPNQAVGIWSERKAGLKIHILNWYLVYPYRILNFNPFPHFKNMFLINNFCCDYL